MEIFLPALFGLQSSFQACDLRQQVPMFLVALVAAVVVREDALERERFSDKVGRRLQRAAAFLFQSVIGGGGRHPFHNESDLKHVRSELQVPGLTDRFYGLDPIAVNE